MDESLSGLEGGGLFPRLQSRYGLRSDPTAMETPFFPDAQRQHALETLRHLCGFGDLALLLTGARGAGKTRILAELVRSESARLSFHRLPTAALTSAQALSRELLGIAHQALTGAGSPRDAVYGFFRWSETATRKGQRLVLLVDDADQMPEEVIRLLLAAFRSADSAKAAVPVFAGSDRLVQALDLVDSGVEAQGVHQIHLRPLTREEVRAYLEPRVRAAGGRVEELLSARNLSRIHELSQGSFGRLKRVAPAVWLDLAAAPAAGRRLPGLATLRWPALALVLLALSWWFVARQYETVSAPEQAREQPVRERKTISLGPENPDVLVTSGEDAPQRTSEPAAEPAPVVPNADRTPAEADPQAAPAATNETPTQASPAPEPLPATQAEPQTGAEPQPEVALEAPPQPEPEPDAEPEAEPEPQGEQAAEPEAEPAPQAEPEPEPQGPGFTPALADRFEPVSQVRDRQGYTAQYIAGYQEATVVSFLRQHDSVPGLRYTRTERGGRSWFVVFYGQYDTREQARADLARLPRELRQLEPWIRSLANM